MIGLLFSVSSFNVSTKLSSVSRQIANAIEAGNYERIASYFNDNVNLIIENTEETYSKNQAELIIKAFFESHAPLQFQFDSSGANGSSQYVHGNLITNQGKFRVYFLVKQVDTKYYILQLYIE